jgi:hypothetical protein
MDNTVLILNNMRTDDVIFTLDHLLSHFTREQKFSMINISVREIHCSLMKSASADKVKHNCHFLTSSRNCMTDC